MNKYLRKLKKIIKEEIKIEPSLKDYADCFVIQHRNNRLQNLIYEGLITSHPIEKCYIIFNRKFKNKLKLQRLKNYDLGISLIPFYIKKQYYNDMVKLMNNLGWHISEISYLTDKGFEYVSNINDLPNIANAVNIVFSSKFQIEFDNKKLPEFIYHVSLSKYKDKILKKGLIPKKKNKTALTQNAIFFSLTDKDYKKLAKKLYPEETEFVLLKINTKGLKNKRFIYDPKVSNEQSIFTLENIDRNNIEIIKFSF